MSELQQLIADKRELGQEVCQRMTETIVNMGLALPPALPWFDGARFELAVDPFTQSRDLVGYWYKDDKQRVGQIRFHGDGSFYAEYDVVQPHPDKPQCFVEAVNAWGRDGNIKTEAKLLDLPQD